MTAVGAALVILCAAHIAWCFIDCAADMARTRIRTGVGVVDQITTAAATAKEKS